MLLLNCYVSHPFGVNDKKRWQFFYFKKLCKFCVGFFFGVENRKIKVVIKIIVDEFSKRNGF